ncbi:MAG TPA: AN1-type zinc finger domain-containing protein [Nitrososphaerales archaeon]|nr:AN1-type zinc finger domain-containing protein [Nitrososphaerales archaeon]
MKCEFCGVDEPLPFVCNYCGGVFCANHRLPEAHQCKGDLSQRRTVVAPPQTNYTFSSPGYPPQPEIKPGSPFSVLEVRDIAVAYLSLGLAFSIVLVRNGVLSSFTLPGIAEVAAIALIAVGPGFVLHELSHKFAARRYGHWAEFRMWPLGLLLALVTSLIGFIFAAPGATYISGINITKEENGRISLAGPLTNVAVALVFVPLFLFTGGFLQTLGFFGVYINLFLALFNMIPVLPLDGAKVLSWSVVRWASLFVPLLVAFLVVFFSSS